jgi:nucleoid DNA-binding protein
MNKSDLIREVHQRMNKKIALKDIDALVNSLFEVMSEKLKSGEEVQLDDFGTFAMPEKVMVSALKNTPSKK